MSKYIQEMRNNTNVLTSKVINGKRISAEKSPEQYMYFNAFQSKL